MPRDHGGSGRFTSLVGPSVWTGRALQAENDDLEMIGLALLYPALEWNVCSWPSWISARARSHSRLGPEGHKGHLITNALARPFLHLLTSTRRPRRESQLRHLDHPFGELAYPDLRLLPL